MPDQYISSSLRTEGKLSTSERRRKSFREIERGLTQIHSFDDPWIIAGQGTIGVELLEDLPEVDTAIVPIQGGGLFNGIALALKAINPDLRMVGVTMDRAPVMYHSLEAGTPLDMEELPTLADALVGGIGGDLNKITFDLTRRHIDEYVLVSEEEIASAMVFMLKEHKVVVEGAGAVGVAALLHNKILNLGENAAVVVSGSGVDIEMIVDLVHGKLPYK